MAEKLPWMRLYVEVLNDPKVQNLPDYLFKTWINLLLIARINNQRGKIPDSIKDLAFMLHFPEKKTIEHIDELARLGLIDDGIMHNWEVRQFESDQDPTNNERQKRYREKKQSVKKPLHNGRVTRYITDEKRLPDTDTEAETEISNKEFALFYDSYPRKEGKKAALKTYNAKVKGGAAHDEIMASLAVYKKQVERNRTETKFIKLPATFLNCFEEYKPEPKPTRPPRLGFKKGLVCPYCDTELPERGVMCPKCRASQYAGFEDIEKYYEVIA